MKDKQTIYIRVDMNKEIATGHMMRCLSIADEISEFSGKVTFIVADRNACELLEKRGYEHIVLDTSWNDMDSEIPIMQKLVADRNIKKLIIDSYTATAKYLSAMTDVTYTMYIDDLKRNDLSVDAVLCYAIYADKQVYMENCADRKIKLLLGTDYVPLRKVFQDIPPKNIKENISNILILSGGADPYITIEQCIDVLSKEYAIQIHAICGRYSEQARELRQLYKEKPNVHIHESVDDIERYMQEADVCISAAGTTLYELCACGTPTLSYILADNQIDNAKGFAEKGIITCLGDVRESSIIYAIRDGLKKLNNSDIRMVLSDKMRRLVDGNGCKRIVKSM